MPRAMKIDPAAILAGTTLLCIAISCLQGLRASTIALGIGAIFPILARIPAHVFWARFRAVNIFILFIWLVVSWTTPGTPVYPHLPFTHEGIRICLLATLKANAILCIFTALLSPLTTTQWGSALATLHCPPSLGWLFLLMERNIRLLSREWQTLRNAARLKGFTPQTSLQTYKVYAVMLARFFLAAHDRAAILNNAVLLRGGFGPLPFPARLIHHASDLGFSLGALFLGAILVIVSHFLP